MIKKSLFIVVWVLIVVFLLLFSLVFKDTNTAIVAQVEPMKKAISYHKAVRIEEIYVMPGQMVKPGDILVKVERPDLILDVEKKENEIERLTISIDIADTKLKNRKQKLTMNKEASLRKIDTEIDQLAIIVNNNQELSSQFSSLTGYADTIKQFGASYYQVKLETLKKEKEFMQHQYELEINAENRIYEEEQKTFQILKNQIESELEVLLIEEEQLIKVAEIHGTVGSVNAQQGELLSPYTTILSIYESNPTIIKAVMNEGYTYNIEVGKIVNVESTKRGYSIDGEIIEIGARIIEYPGRLKANQNIQMWGQELFIKIPKDNLFLNGERVAVIIKE